jgi:hypothetical protein
VRAVLHHLVGRGNLTLVYNIIYNYVFIKNLKENTLHEVYLPNNVGMRNGLPNNLSPASSYIQKGYW